MRGEAWSCWWQTLGQEGQVQPLFEDEIGVNGWSGFSPSVNWSIHSFIYFLINQFIYPPTNQLTNLFPPASTHPPIHPLNIHPSIYPSVHPSILREREPYTVSGYRDRIRSQRKWWTLFWLFSELNFVAGDGFLSQCCWSSASQLSDAQLCPATINHSCRWNCHKLLFFISWWSILV